MLIRSTLLLSLALWMLFGCSATGSATEGITSAANSVVSTATSAGSTSEQCMKVTLTGTMGGPSAFNGLAGAGTLVSYGTRSADCRGTQLQFDVGRGTVMRLSQLNINPNQLDAVFFTHMHSDHTAGFSDLITTRWHFTGGPLPVVCSDDIEIGAADARRTISCDNLIKNSAATAEQSGEITQRAGENPRRNKQGPSAIGVAQLVESPLPQTPQEVWRKDDVVVSAIAVTHIPGSLAYRVDTPAGSVVIGGDAGNKKTSPPREQSTSENVELLAKDADVVVHSVIHPVMGPEGSTKFPPRIFYRQSTPRDLGAMAQRSSVKYLMFTHMIPALGAKGLGPFKFAEPLTATDYIEQARLGEFTGEVMVGEDLMTLTLPR